MNQRTAKRLPWQKECILFNQFGLIKAQTVYMSRKGLRVKTDSALPLKFKNGCKLTVLISGMDLPQAELIWTMQSLNNTTRLGLKFSTSIID